MNIPLGPDPFFAAYWVRDVWDFLNSNFFAGLFGAGFGTWGAQRLAERAKRREEMLKEIRATNAASSAAAAIAITAIGIRKDTLGPAIATFEAQRAEYQALLERREIDEAARRTPVELPVALRKLSLPKVPSELLQQQMFEKLSIVGRPLLLTVVLGQSLQELSLALEKRNQVIESYGDGSSPIPAAHHLGFPVDGVTHEGYSTAISNIKTQLKNAIFFSTLLCRDLTAHGDEITEDFESRFRKKAPRVYRANFDEPIKAGLVPPDTDYPDWFLKIKTHQKEKPPSRLAQCRGKARDWLIKVRERFRRQPKL